MKPSQKVGIEKPETAKTITPATIQEPLAPRGHHADRHPDADADQHGEQGRTRSVAAARWPMSVETGSPEKIEVPRSPRTTRPSQIADLHVEGLIETQLGVRMRAMSSVVA